MSVLSTAGAADQAAPPQDLSPQDQKRAQILEAARCCFARGGFHGASMHQICAEAKMSPGALYRYFPGKDAIIEAIAEDERSRAKDCLSLFLTDAPIVDRVVAAAMHYFSLMRTPGQGELMTEIFSESMRNTAVGQRFKVVEDEVRRLFREGLDASRARGEIAAAVDVDTVAAVMLSIGDGLAMRMILDPTLDPARLEEPLRRITVALLHPADHGEVQSTDIAAP